ncbi:hypothetical protein ACSSS7_002578 [Eimeria intestinalis]
MELHSDTTRFALACNSSSSVIEPLQSRCSILRFTKLSDAHLVQRLREVCHKENITFTDDGIEALVFSADGDMRNALNNLQSTVSGFGIVNKTNVEKARTVEVVHCNTNGKAAAKATNKIEIRVFFYFSG